MNNKKLIVGLVGLVIVIGIGALLFSLKKEPLVYMPVLGDTPTTTPYKVKVPEKTTENIQTTNWNTYVNNEYGFEMKFPPRWSKMSVVVSKNNTTILYPADVHFTDINFNLANSYNSSYVKVCSIRIFSNKDWEKIQNSVYVPTRLDQKGDSVYAAVCSDDDSGFVGFENYKGEGGAVIGPNQEFEIITSTFKFI